jgi:uncharacterized protein YrzB (UPF0473 family)
MEKNKIQAGEYEAPVITLTLEDDSELDCAVIAVFDVEGYTEYQYAALLPVDQIDSEDGELFLYRYRELSDDEVDVQNIEDDAEFEAVSERFDAILDEEEFNEIEIDLGNGMSAQIPQ